MSETENLLGQGLQLTLFGMGTVFVFLVLLIFATRAMSALAVRWSPPADTQEVDSRPDPSTHDPRLLAAIAAAVRLYREGRRQ